MSEYRRYFVAGGTYFFTIVTSGRRPILITDAGRKHLRNAIVSELSKRPFELCATVLLPDHWHLLMVLPPGDDKSSVRIKRIKGGIYPSLRREWFARSIGYRISNETG